MNKVCAIASALLILLFAGLISGDRLLAQSTLTSTGTPTTSPTWPVENGVVNLSSGNLHLEIPVGNLPQRGDLHLGATLIYDSAIWQVVAGPINLNWVPVSSGWSLYFDGTQGANAKITSTACASNSSLTVFTYSAFEWLDAHGTVHVFPIKTTDLNGCTGGSLVDQPNGEAYATDGSGVYGLVSNYNVLDVFDQSGTRVLETTVPSFGASSSQIVDRNGNYIQYGVGGTVTNDTLHHSPIVQTVVSTDGSGNPRVLWIDVPGPQGQTTRYTITYKTIQVSTAFNRPAIDFAANQPPGNVLESTASLRVVDSVGLPDGTSYSFAYDEGCPGGSCGGGSPATSYGLLTGITLPHGGVVSYQYASDNHSGVMTPARWVSSYTGSTGATSFQYSYQGSYPNTLETGGNTCPELRNVVVSGDLTTTHQFANCSGSILPMKTISAQTQNSSAVSSFTLASYDFSHPCDADACTGSQWILPIETATVLPGSGSVQSILSGVGGTGLTTDTQTQYSAPGSGRISSLKTWDFRTGTYPTSLPDSPSGLPKLQTEWAWNYPVNHIQFATGTTTKDSSGTVVEETQYLYDELSYQTTVGAGSWPNQSDLLASANRGNVTSTKTISHGAIVVPDIIVHATYDHAGSVRSRVDANGAVSTTNYEATNTFPIDETKPQTAGTGSSIVSHITHATFDLNTGLMTSKTDENGQTLSYQYDQAGRMLATVFSNGASPKTLASYSYPNGNEVDVTTLQVDDAYMTASVTATTTYDGYGRVIQLNRNGIMTDTTYDSRGRTYSISNPHSSTTETTDGITYFAYDELGRNKTTTYPNGHGVGWTYVLNTVTSIDQLQHSRQHTTDVAGNIVATLEPDDTGALNWETDFVRDDMGRILHIYQKGGSTDPSQWRPRDFVYDGVGRLHSETSKERGQILYSYDQNGNMLQQQNDNVTANTVTSTYDSLNRLRTKQIGGGQSYTYTYDAQDASGDAFGAGVLTSITDGSGIDVLLKHDPLGRVIGQSERRSPTGAYVTTSAGYDFAGNLRFLIYPDGRRVDWVYNLENKPTDSIYTFWNTDEVDVPLMAGGTYYPAGELKDIFDGSGVELSAIADSTGSITGLNYNNGGTPLVQRVYNWDVNGKNLVSMTDVASGRSQGFSYDQLDRVKVTTDSGSTTAATNSALPVFPSHAESYSYDAWGNAKHTGNYQFTPDYDGLNHVVAFTYDSAGDLTSDNLNSYSYRADGQITAANGIQYGYDGFNQRVVKTQPGIGQTNYYYFGGRLVSLQNVTTGAWTDTLYGAHGILGVVDGTEFADPLYRIGDPLDSALLSTDVNGMPLGAATTTPFGQIISNTTDGTFIVAGMQRDSEDESAQTDFRKYSPYQGRWLSPDIAANYDVTDPQSLNRYAYVQNQPLAYLDPFGLDRTCAINWDYFDCSKKVNQLYAPGHGDGGGAGSSGSWDLLTGDRNTVTLGGHGVGSAQLPGYTERMDYKYDTPNSAPLVSQKQIDCALDALHENYVSISLDVIGVFVPGGGAIGAVAQTAFGVGSIAHSALSGDSSATGLTGVGASFVGLQANVTRAAASYALRGTEFGLARTLVKSLPGVSQLANGLAAGADLYTAYKDYKKCMAKPK